MYTSCPTCGRSVSIVTGCWDCNRRGPRSSSPFPVPLNPFNQSHYRDHRPRFREPNERMRNWLGGLDTGYDMNGHPREGRGGGGSRGCRYPLWCVGGRGRGEKGRGGERKGVDIEDMHGVQIIRGLGNRDIILCP
jgi:hypothetical protein